MLRIGGKGLMKPCVRACNLEHNLKLQERAIEAPVVGIGFLCGRIYGSRLLMSLGPLNSPLQGIGGIDRLYPIWYKKPRLPHA